MTAKIIQLSDRRKKYLPVKDCQVCLGNDGTYLNIERDHYGVCIEHLTYWFIGSNLNSGWRDENPEIWAENKAALSKLTFLGENSPFGGAA